MRFLPHFEDDGETTRALHWTRCYMAFPECEQDAIRAATVLDDESRAIKLRLQSDFGVIGKLVRKKLQSRQVTARISGVIFYQMILNCVRTGEPDFRKAVFAVAEWASLTKDTNGKSLPASGDNFRKQHIPEFRSSLHLWASFEFLEPTEKKVAFNNTAVFHKLMIGAEAMQRLAIHCDMAAKTKAMAAWEPWQPHPVYGELIDSGDFEIQLPGEDRELLSALKNYTNKPFENRR